MEEHCQWVYLDGSETLGGEDVAVTVRYKQHKTVISLLVYYPELPLRVLVSDDILNAVHNWRVPHTWSVKLPLTFDK